MIALALPATHPGVSVDIPERRTAHAGNRGLRDRPGRLGGGPKCQVPASSSLAIGQGSQHLVASRRRIATSLDLAWPEKPQGIRRRAGIATFRNRPAGNCNERAAVGGSLPGHSRVTPGSSPGFHVMVLLGRSHAASMQREAGSTRVVTLPDRRGAGPRAAAPGEPRSTGASGQSREKPVFEGICVGGFWEVRGARSSQCEMRRYLQ